MTQLGRQSDEFSESSFASSNAANTCSAVIILYMSPESIERNFQCRNIDRADWILNIERSKRHDHSAPPPPDISTSVESSLMLFCLFLSVVVIIPLPNRKQVIIQQLTGKASSSALTRLISGFQGIICSDLSSSSSSPYQWQKAKKQRSEWKRTRFKKAKQRHEFVTECATATALKFRASQSYY